MAFKGKRLRFLRKKNSFFANKPVKLSLTNT